MTTDADLRAAGSDAAPGSRAEVARGYARPRLATELLVVACLLFVYDRIRQLADVHTADALAHGQLILRLEAVVHANVERGINAWLAMHGGLEFLAAGYYEVLH